MAEQKKKDQGGPINPMEGISASAVMGGRGEMKINSRAPPANGDDSSAAKPKVRQRIGLDNLIDFYVASP